MFTVHPIPHHTLGFLIKPISTVPLLTPPVTLGFFQKKIGCTPSETLKTPKKT